MSQRAQAGPRAPWWLVVIRARAPRARVRARLYILGGKPDLELESARQRARAKRCSDPVQLYGPVDDVSFDVQAHIYFKISLIYMYVRGYKVLLSLRLKTCHC